MQILGQNQFEETQHTPLFDYHQQKNENESKALLFINNNDG